MMIDAKGVLLGLDMDTAISLLGRDRYPYALNVTKDATLSVNSDGVLTNIVGNRLVDYTLPAGTNKVIGAFGHLSRNTVLYFVYNSNGNHSILEYNNTTRAIAKVLISKTDSDSVDILGFTLTGKIHSVNVVIRDEGDLLYFLDSLGRPTVLNIARLKAGAYTPVTRAIIDVAKDVPLSPPTCNYSNDTARKVNNLRNKLFRFKTRYVGDEWEKTTCSPVSKVPLPASILDETYTNVVTNNNRISVTFTTGDKSVKGIELLVSYANKTNAWSDFELVKTFNKAAESISNDTTTTFDFYNDSTYFPIDVNESIQLFDYTPDLAGAQAMPNGNVLCYGAITEGYDRTLSPNVTFTIGTETVGAVGTVGTLVANYVDEGIGSTFYHASVNFAGTPANGTIIRIRARWRTDGYEVLIGEVTFDGTTIATVSDIVNYLRTHILRGYIGIDDYGSNFIKYSLRREYYEPMDTIPDSPNTSGVFIKIEVVSPATSGPVESASTPHLKWSSEQTYGIQYFDKKGKTNGVLYSAKVTIPAYAESGGLPLVPTLSIKIRHQPPLWAHSYTLVVNKNATSYLYWQSVGVESDDDYLYFNISNMEVNRDKKPTTASVLQWAYAEGDRMRLLKRIADGTVYNETYEASLEGIVVDPKIKGADKKGRYVKIKKVAPFAALDITNGNFVLELYRPAQGAATPKNETFFEFGEQYPILDAGLSTRRHGGGVSNQSIDLTTTPAETNISAGDAYLRVRNIYLTESTGGRFFVMDRNFVDFYPSAVSSVDGRPTAIDESAKRAYYPTLVRFGGAIQQNTNINALNRFYGNNYDEYSLAYGDIRRLAVRNQYLYVFQKLKVGNVPLYSQIQRDSNGGVITVVTDKLLNPINYYMGEFGIGDAPESLAQFNYAFYFCDTVRGAVLRLSQDGIQVLSELYKMNAWAKSEITQRGDTAKIYGAYEPDGGKYIMALEAVGSSAAQTLVFDEKSNAFESFVSYQPESMVALGNLLISFKNGGLYTHDNTTYNTFYGTAYNSEVQVVFNANYPVKKTFKAVTQMSSSVWECPLIYTDLESYAGQRQESNLLAGEFEKKENGYHAGFLRDQHSIGGISNGDELKGNLVVVKFRKINAINFIDLRLVSVQANPNAIAT